MQIEIEILSRRLDRQMICPLCQNPMYDIEGEIVGRVYQFYQCKSCQHQIFPQQDRICYCEQCEQERKKLMRETSRQEKKKYEKPDKSQKYHEKALLPMINDLTFIQKLFLLSVLDYYVNEERTHGEYMAWDKIKYYPITPNYQYQAYLFKLLIQQGFVVEHNHSGFYYLNISLDGLYDSSLYHIHQGLKSGFCTQLHEYIPFKHENEVKFALYQMMYQEVVQFMQFICGQWKIQIAGNSLLERFCQQLMGHLALSQIFYLVKHALEYLNSKKLLKKKNDDFVNTNLLRKTLMEYEQKIIHEKWETASILRPESMPMSHMSQLFYYQFLNLRENFYYQPLWKIWQNVQPRLTFFAQRRCLYCGSHDVWVEYDQFQQISLKCQMCHRQYHYQIG